MARQNIQNITPGQGPYRSMVVNGTTSFPWTGILFWIKPLIQNVQPAWMAVAQGQTDNAGNFSLPVQLSPPNDQMSDYAITLLTEHPDQPASSPTTQPSSLVIHSATGGISSISLAGTGTPNYRVDVHKAGTGEKLGQIFISPYGSFSDTFGNTPSNIKGNIPITARQTGDGFTFSNWISEIWVCIS